MVQADKSVAGFVRSMSLVKTGLETEVLKRVLDEIQSTDRGPASEIIDLAFAVTGYGKAGIPGGECQAAGHCIAVLVKYLTLRAKEPTNESSESLEGCLLDLVIQSVHLYSEVNVELNANRGTRVVSPLTEKRS